MNTARSVNTSSDYASTPGPLTRKTCAGTGDKTRSGPQKNQLTSAWSFELRTSRSTEGELLFRKRRKSGEICVGHYSGARKLGVFLHGCPKGSPRQRTQKGGIKNRGYIGIHRFHPEPTRRGKSSLPLGSRPALATPEPYPSRPLSRLIENEVRTSSGLLLLGPANSGDRRNQVRQLRESLRGVGRKRLCDGLRRHHRCSG